MDYEKFKKELEEYDDWERINYNEGDNPTRPRVPGKSKKRYDIKFPVGDRIFFAGEATAGAFSTVHGANRSGVRAATDLYISSALD